MWRCAYVEMRGCDCAGDAGSQSGRERRRTGGAKRHLRMVTFWAGDAAEATCETGAAAERRGRRVVHIADKGLGSIRGLDGNELRAPVAGCACECKLSRHCA